MEKKTYADVWGDTVDIRHLAFAMIIGIVISLLCYVLGLSFVKSNFPKVPANLTKAYALLIGILGSLISAFVSAKLFKPKRILKEGHFSEEDRNLVLDELQIDRNKEAEELKTAGPAIIEEMKQLQLYDLFVDKNQSKR